VNTWKDVLSDSGKFDETTSILSMQNNEQEDFELGDY